MVNLRYSCFDVLKSNFNILQVLGQFSLKIAINYKETFSYFFKILFLSQNSRFQ